VPLLLFSGSFTRSGFSRATGATVAVIPATVPPIALSLVTTGIHSCHERFFLAKQSFDCAILPRVLELLLSSQVLDPAGLAKPVVAAIVLPSGVVPLDRTFHQGATTDSRHALLLLTDVIHRHPTCADGTTQLYISHL
jgi:hypothetical protein